MMKWYCSQLSNVKWTDLKDENDIEYWKKTLINWFKKSYNDAFYVL